MLDSFWSLASKSASQTSVRRFLRHYQEYLDAVCLQARDRENNHVRTIDEYFELRRDTIGAKPFFDLLLLPLEIPDEILNDPKIGQLAQLSIDMIIMANVSIIFLHCNRARQLSNFRMSIRITSNSPAMTMTITWLQSP